MGSKKNLGFILVFLCEILKVTLLLLHAITKIPEEVVVWFQNLAWAPNSQKDKDSNF